MASGGSSSSRRAHLPWLSPFVAKTEPETASRTFRRGGEDRPDPRYGRHHIRIGMFSMAESGGYEAAIEWIEEVQPGFDWAIDQTDRPTTIDGVGYVCMVWDGM